jgi:hypothetical protein
MRSETRRFGAGSTSLALRHQRRSGTKLSASSATPLAMRASLLA